MIGRMTSPAAPPFDRVRWPALGVGMAGLALSAVGWIFSPEQFFSSYLVAYLFWLGIGLGCLAIALLQFVTGGAWGLVARRVLESGAGTLPLMALLFLPLVFGLRTLYVWARPEVVAGDPLLQYKSAYLNVPFFLLRAAVYLGSWAGLAYVLGRWSAEQVRAPHPRLTRKLRRLSIAGLLLVGFTATFAAIDWTMSLEPDWYSTVYGGMVGMGQVLGAFAFTIVVLALLSDRPPLAAVTTPGLFNDLGSLLLAFLMLWAYLAYSQLLLIWAGNLSEEIPWYLRRIEGTWWWVALSVALLGFALPFCLLVFRDLKRSTRALATTAGLLLVMRFVEAFWLVKPVFDRDGVRVRWLDLAALIGVGGVWVACFVWWLGARPLLPRHDPRLPGAEGARP